MIMSEKSKQHVESCRFCWMCHHICPIGNATGQERNTPRARALGISLVNRGAIEFEEIIDNIYECAGCGACVHDCTTGWNPVMFTKEVRLAAATEDKLPPYIAKLVDNCLDTGNAYGKTALCSCLTPALARHAGKTDTLLVLGVNARYRAETQAIKAIEVLEKAGVGFTVLEDEPATGAQLDFLIGAAEDTVDVMRAAAKVFADYKTVVFYDTADAKTVKQTFGEYGVELSSRAVTYTAYLAELLAAGKLPVHNTGKTVVFQDPFRLARDLEETEEARTVISAFATLREFHLNCGETVWAGDILMAEYMPKVIKLVAERRIGNAKSIGESVIVTADVSEYTVLKAVAPADIEILSIEDLILG